MTLRQAWQHLRTMGITIRKTEHDEYRVNYLGGTEATAYYTPHLDDAVQTGTAMAAEMRRNPSYKKYSGREGSAEFRPMLLEEAKMLHYGQHIWMLARDGSAVRVKVNGTPKRWKREPDRIEVPVKYGLYEYLTLTTRDFGPDGVALVEI